MGQVPLSFIAISAGTERTELTATQSNDRTGLAELVTTSWTEEILLLSSRMPFSLTPTSPASLPLIGRLPVQRKFPPLDTEKQNKAAPEH